MDRQLLRILDANLNRSREGLRVCEDICRFYLDDKKTMKILKSIRHGISDVVKTLPRRQLLESRDARTDRGRRTDRLEITRAGWRDVYFANIQRAKESLRVLEEISKLTHPAKTRAFKKLRFDLYDFEKRFTV